jgi:hypothetical protein
LNLIIDKFDPKIISGQKVRFYHFSMNFIENHFTVRISIRIFLSHSIFVHVVSLLYVFALIIIDTI